MFETYTAAQYRALDDAKFVARKQEVIDLLNSETRPEGLTDDMLYAEADLIEADEQRRNRAASLRNSSLTAVAAGAGTVIASSEPSQKRSGIQTVSEGKFIESTEYRSALAKHIAHVEKMPAEFIARARQERSAGDPVSVSFADGYTNMVDPTFSNTVSTTIPVPLTMGELIEARRESGLIYPLVSQTSYKGGVVYPVRDLTVDFHWITDKQVSPYQYDNDATVVSFTWHELEARFARTNLVNALISDNFKNQLAGALADGYGRIIDDAILNGNGTTQPLGITVDPRVVGYGTSGQSGYVAPAATMVEASADDLSSWDWWVKLLYNPSFNRLYRNDGTWLIGDSTFGTYIETLKDEVNRPLAKFDPLNDEAPYKIRGNAVVTLPNALLGDFDSATAGDVIAVFGNLRNYALNFQPGMPLSTVSWEDYETNTQKTRVLTAVDGKVLDNHGWVVITKKASA